MKHVVLIAGQSASGRSAVPTACFYDVCEAKIMPTYVFCRIGAKRAMTTKAAGVLPIHVGQIPGRGEG